MNRRAFVAGWVALPAAAGLRAPHDVKVTLEADAKASLEAIVAPELPSSLELPSEVRTAIGIADDDSRLFELRTYLNADPALDAWLSQLFSQMGVSAVRCENGTWLIAFDSMSDREQTWSRVNAHPDWPRLTGAFTSYGFSIYRVTVA